MALESEKKEVALDTASKELENAKKKGEFAQEKSERLLTTFRNTTEATGRTPQMIQQFKEEWSKCKFQQFLAEKEQLYYQAQLQKLNGENVTPDIISTFQKMNISSRIKSELKGLAAKPKDNKELERSQCFDHKGKNILEATSKEVSASDAQAVGLVYTALSLVDKLSTIQLGDLTGMKDISEDRARLTELEQLDTQSRRGATQSPRTVALTELRQEYTKSESEIAKINQKHQEELSKFEAQISVEDKSHKTIFNQQKAYVSRTKLKQEQLKEDDGFCKFQGQLEVIAKRKIALQAEKSKREKEIGEIRQTGLQKLKGLASQIGDLSRTPEESAEVEGLNFEFSAEQDRYKELAHDTKDRATATDSEVEEFAFLSKMEKRIAVLSEMGRPLSNEETLELTSLRSKVSQDSAQSKENEGLKKELSSKIKDLRGRKRISPQERKQLAESGKTLAELEMRSASIEQIMKKEADANKELNNIMHQEMLVDRAFTKMVKRDVEKITVDIQRAKQERLPPEQIAQMAEKEMENLKGRIANRIKEKAANLPKIAEANMNAVYWSGIKEISTGKATFAEKQRAIQTSPERIPKQLTRAEKNFMNLLQPIEDAAKPPSG